MAISCEGYVEYQVALDIIAGELDSTGWPYPLRPPPLPGLTKRSLRTMTPPLTLTSTSTIAIQMLPLLALVIPACVRVSPLYINRL